MIRAKADEELGPSGRLRPIPHLLQQRLAVVLIGLERIAEAWVKLRPRVVGLGLAAAKSRCSARHSMLRPAGAGGAWWLPGRVSVRFGLVNLAAYYVSRGGVRG